MKVIDCVLLHNELDLLEIRLHELSAVVDVHVIVEATTTFSGQPRAVAFDPAHPRWAPFAPRIVHVVVDDAPPLADPWGREHFQRNAILRGLTEPQPGALRLRCNPLDLILIGDVDEIPRAAAVAGVRDRLASGVAAFAQAFSYYHVNQRARHAASDAADGASGWHVWTGTKAVRFCEMPTPQQLRDTPPERCATVVEDGGWHFSYCGGVAAIRDKIAAYAHQEHNHPAVVDPGHIERAVREGRDLFGRDGELRFDTVPLDDSFPGYLRANQDRFGHLIASQGDRLDPAEPPPQTGGGGWGPGGVSLVRDLFDSDAAYRDLDPERDPPGFSVHWSLAPVMERLVEELRPRRIIEVGSWQGSSAIHMARACGPWCRELICIDTWLGSAELVLDQRAGAEIVRSRHFGQLRHQGGYPRVFFTFLSNVVAAGFSHLVTPAPLTSEAAWRILKQLDVRAQLIYIDGAHEYEPVRRDLDLYWELLDPGGVLFGDDFHASPDVNRAAREFAARVGRPIEDIDGKYVIRKP